MPDTDVAYRRDSNQRNKDRATIARGRPACGICGQPIDYTLPYLDPGEYVVDHVVPLAKGGLDHISNKQAAHRLCNREKGDKDFAARIVRRSSSLA